MLITLASGNANKERELQALISGFETSGFKTSIQANPAMPEVDETGVTFIDNARLKALACPLLSGSEWILAEDSGLIIEALDGQYELSPFPGVRSNRWLTQDLRMALLGIQSDEPNTYDQINQAILKLMTAQANRKAQYVCGMTLIRANRNDNIQSGQPHQVLFEASGTMDLEVAQTIRGTEGFGYDPIMIPIENNPTVLSVSEMSLADKNKISHRACAFKQVLDYLKNQT